MKELILVRGLPGSGKSTFAQALSSALEPYVEADMYFYDDKGNYDFDATKLKDAHMWCQSMVQKWMGDGINGLNKIIVSNTFTTEKEMKPYFDMANHYGYTVYTIVVENRHGGVNKHDVPQDTLDKMANRFNIKLR